MSLASVLVNDMEFSHIPVLLNETLEGLNIKPDGIYVDGTAGGAGHSKEIAKRNSTKILSSITKIIRFD